MKKIFVVSFETFCKKAREQKWTSNAESFNDTYTQWYTWEERATIQTERRRRKNFSCDIAESALEVTIWCQFRNEANYEMKWCVQNHALLALTIRHSSNATHVDFFSLPSSDDGEDGKATQCYKKGNLTSDTMIAMILKVPISIDEILLVLFWFFAASQQTTELHFSHLNNLCEVIDQLKNISGKFLCGHRSLFLYIFLYML